MMSVICQLKRRYCNQHRQRNSPCCILEISAISRNKPVQNHLAFARFRSEPGHLNQLILGMASMPHQMFFGGLNVLNGAGLKPLAVMRQARKTVLFEGLVPENFDGEFSVRSIQ